MAEEDNDQKTEEASSKRLEEARERGQLPVSREIGSLFLFVAILTVVAWFGPSMMSDMVKILRVFIEMPQAMLLDDRELQTVLLHVVVQVAKAAGLVFAVLAAAAILGTMLQTGMLVSLELIQPDLERLSPMRGIKRLFSMTALVELGKSILKMIVFGYVVYLCLAPVVNDLPSLLGHSLMDIMAYLQHQAVHLILMLLLIFMVIAVIDILYQRFNFFKNLRMTKAEVKDEYKQQEGDPAIKGRLRQIRLDKARKRMMAQVPKADVIITNPTHYAVALQYDTQKMAAPVVLAKGTDKVAERIRGVAEEHKIPLVSNPPLARALYETVDIDQAIPTQHYRAVAEVISYVYKLKKRKF